VQPIKVLHLGRLEKART